MEWKCRLIAPQTSFGANLLPSAWMTFGTKITSFSLSLSLSLRVIIVSFPSFLFREHLDPEPKEETPEVCFPSCLQGPEGPGPKRSQPQQDSSILRGSSAGRRRPPGTRSGEEKVLLEAATAAEEDWKVTDGSRKREGGKNNTRDRNTRKEVSR